MSIKRYTTLVDLMIEFGDGCQCGIEDLYFYE
jgi:hypothetical protein